MAASPRFKLYFSGSNGSWEYRGSMKEVGDAAVIASIYAGWQIRDGHKIILWTNTGLDQSYDEICEQCWAIIDKHSKA